MSFTAMTWAREQRTGSPTTKSVLMAIANYANDDGTCYPSQTTLAFDTEFSERAVRDAMKKLEESGFIRRTPRRWDNSQSYTSDWIVLQVVKAGLSPIARRTANGKAVMSHRQVEPTDGQIDFDPPAPDAELPAAAADPQAACSNPSGTSCPTHRQLAPNPPAGAAAYPIIEPDIELSEGSESCSPLRVEPQIGGSRKHDLTRDIANQFDQFWDRFPNKIGKGAARTIFDRLMRKNVVPFDELMEGLGRYVNKTDTRDWCLPATWLNQERWSDEMPATQTQKPKVDRYGKPLGRLGISGAV